MKRYPLLYLITLLFGTVAEAQDSFLAAEISYNSYSMSSLKKYQQDILQQSGLPLTIVNSFPSYVGFGGSMGFRLNARAAIGIDGGYMSTGGRLDYEDYSGVARSDLLVRGYSLGAFIQFKINHGEKWSVNLTLHSGSMLSHVVFKDMIQSGLSNTVDEESGNSFNYSFKPAISVRRYLKNYFIETGMAYELQLHRKIYSSDDSKSYLVDSSGSPVVVQWDGIRIFLRMGIAWNRVNAL
jgi:hypothetical protein